MSSIQYVVDSYYKHLAMGNLALATGPIKVALLAEFSPTYPAWAASTGYAIGDIVVPTTPTGRRYRATTTGSSGSSEPTWPTAEGGTVTDNSVIWEEYGGEHANVEFFNEVLANELPDGNGYTMGGKVLANKSLTQDPEEPRAFLWDADDVLWESITATVKTAWIYVDGATPGTDDFVISYILLDDTPASVSINSVDLSLKFNSDGIHKITRKV